MAPTISHKNSEELPLTLYREEDVSQTLYKDTLRALKVDTAAQTLTNPAKKGNKVNKICDGFLAALEKRSESNLHNLITAYVCKLPPDLESGLQLVARLRGSSTLPPFSSLYLLGLDESPEQAEDAVEHMCFLTDANRLYDTALGLYDLELTLLVAQQAQRVSTLH